jgi:hypothetical protein
MVDTMERRVDSESDLPQFHVVPPLCLVPLSNEFQSDLRFPDDGFVSEAGTEKAFKVHLLTKGLP